MIESFFDELEKIGASIFEQTVGRWAKSGPAKKAVKKAVTESTSTGHARDLFRNLARKTRPQVLGSG
jgi:hypothetical protein